MIAGPMKAMILTAGLGTRLRPLTLDRAKPVIPLLGKPLVVRLVERLHKAGVTAFRLNLHHLPETIRSVFGTSPYDLLPVSFSYEPQILGTAGGLKSNEAFFDSDPFLMANGDIVADFDLHDAMAFHRARNAMATMVLRVQPAPYRHTSIRIDKDHRIRGFKGRRSAGTITDDTYAFTGIHILDTRIFEFIPPRVFHEINDQVYPLLMDKGMDIFGFPVEGYWNDLGDPRRYLEATGDLLASRPSMVAAGLSAGRSCSPGPEGTWVSTNTGDMGWPGTGTSPHDRSARAEGSYVSEEAVLMPGARVKGCSIEAGCVLEEGARLADCILWEGVRIKKGVRLSRCIVGTGITVERDCHGMIVTGSGETPIA